ncbi:MAG: hypothetical protein K8S00_01115 [Bacteroidales bacterium]|nr:hypothetical protein [Bacteroidales bacterium]
MTPFYDDDGTKVNPDLIPVPGMCLVCKKWDNGDSEEEMLCKLTIMDQRNSSVMNLKV